MIFDLSLGNYNSQVAKVTKQKKIKGLENDKKAIDNKISYLNRNPKTIQNPPQSHFRKRA
jgi:hypothetical protein